jgi:hypothetical protein
MKTTKKTQKMQLGKETLRRLDAELDRVRGGGDTNAVVVSQTRLAATPLSVFCDMSIR